MNMKNTVRMIALLMCLTIMSGLLVCTASADAMYLIPDSGTRKLTAEEIWKWDKIINYLRLPNEVTEREVLALDMSNYKIKDIPSIIANKLLNIDYDYYIKSQK